MLASATVIGFIPTTDFRRAKTFYSTKLGLRFVSRDKFALVFASGRTRIRVVNVGKFTAAGFTVFGWQVAAIEKRVRQLAKRGVNRLRALRVDEAG